MTQSNSSSGKRDNLFGSMFSKKSGKFIGIVFMLMLLPAYFGYDMTYKVVFPVYIGFWQNALICAVVDLVLSVILYFITKKNILSILGFNMVTSFLLVGWVYLGIIILNNLTSTGEKHAVKTYITYVDWHIYSKHRQYDAHYAFPETQVDCYWPMGREPYFSQYDPCTVVYHMGNLGLYVVDDVKPIGKKSESD